MSPPSPAHLRSARRPRASRGISLMEMLLVVALLSVLGGLSAAALGPLQEGFRSRDAATRVAATAARARNGAWQTGRCHLLTVHDGAGPVAAGVPGDRLRLQRRITSDCETAPTAADLEHVEWVFMPERVTVSLVAGNAPEWRAHGRLRGPLTELRVDARGRQLSIQLAPQGAVCVGDAPPGACP